MGWIYLLFRERFLSWIQASHATTLLPCSNHETTLHSKVNTYLKDYKVAYVNVVFISSLVTMVQALLILKSIEACIDFALISFENNIYGTVIICYILCWWVRGLTHNDAEASCGKAQCGSLCCIVCMCKCMVTSTLGFCSCLPSGIVVLCSSTVEYRDT